MEESRMSSSYKKPQVLVLMMVVLAAAVGFSGNYTMSVRQVISKNKDCFDLCGVLLCSKVFPVVQKNTTFGLPGWKRNTSRAIILKNNTCVFGQTGNNIREFLHVFDMAFDNKAELVLHDDNGFPINHTLSQLFSQIDLQFLETELGVTMFDGSRKYAENITVCQKPP